MRLTTEQILEKYPSMWMSGKLEDKEKVLGKYYGDLPYKICPTEPKYGNLDAIDSYVARVYAPQKVAKYLHNHGTAYIREDGFFICGELSVKYGNRDYAYEISCFNGHLGQKGFSIWVQNTGKPTVESFFSPNYYKETDHLREITTKEISREVIDKIFARVLTDDDYGLAAKELVYACKKILKESENV